MARIISMLTFLLAVAFSAEVLGYHARLFNILLSLVFLAIFLWPCFPREVLPRFRRRWPTLLLAVAALSGVFYSTDWIGVLFISLLIGGVRLLRLDEKQDADLGIYQTTAFAYGLFLWFWRETATGWYVLDGAARGLMWLTHHFGLNATLGPTASGLPIIILLFTYGAACTLRIPEQRLRTIARLFVLLLVVQVAFVAVYDAVAVALSVSLLQQRVQGGAVPWYPFAFLQYLYPNNLQGIAFLLGSAAMLALTRAPLQAQGKEKSITPRRRVAIIGAGALLVGTVLLGFVPPRPAAHGGVLICDTGFLDFRVPVYGAFGHKNGGMFGRLPGFLEGSGYRVRRGPVSPENLKSANVLVVINPMESFDRPTKKAVWDFVRRGGGLLVLGDHTCTHNIREPINDLLKPVNIELNFDSAKPFSRRLAGSSFRTPAYGNQGHRRYNKRDSDMDWGFPDCEATGSPRDHWHLWLL